MAASIIKNTKIFSKPILRILNQQGKRSFNKNGSLQILCRQKYGNRYASSIIVNVNNRPGHCSTSNTRYFHVTSSVCNEIVDVKTPAFADSITEGDIQYQKEVGDAVAVDECVAEIETEKTSIPVLSPVAGVVAELCFENGDTIQANQVLFKIKAGAQAEAAAAPPKAEAPPPPPAAAEKTPEPAPVKAPEPKKADTSQAGAIPSKPPPPPAKPTQPMASIPASATKPSPAGRTENRVKMTRMRQTISRRLKEAQNTCAMLTTFNEIDMSNVKQLREQYQDAFMKKHNMKLGFMSAFVKAAAYALQDMPVVNAVIDDTEIVYRDYVDISVAVATPKGLVIPVLRNVESMSYADIEKELNALAVKARNNDIAVEDMAGGTFSISNGGVYGSMFGTPIINPPQSAILGMHGIFDRPMAVQGRVEVRPMMYVALTYDHRLIDGREGVTFLKKIKSAVEDPRVMFLDL